MSVDLSTTYMGLKLANPLAASAGPLTGAVEMLRRLEDAGVAAVVLPSLFEEQIEHEEMERHRLQEFGAESFPEALSYFPNLPELETYNTGPEAYLQHVERAKAEVSVPVIASLNGASSGGWTRYARMMQDAGADALELNIYFLPIDPQVPGQQVETRYLELVASVREAVTIPLAVKVGPYFSAMANIAARLVEAGADGLVLFNRFLQPDIDLEQLQVNPDIELSTSSELRLPLRWVAILHGRVKTSLAVSSGIHTSRDVLKALLAGADVCMLTSALLKHGPEHLRGLLTEMSQWLQEHEYASVAQMRGSMSQQNCPDPAAFERANYMRALTSYTGEQA